MLLLTKLTLVIPTYNRQRYVLRNMRYWSESAVTVHVLDGSAQQIPAEEMAGLSTNVNYHHLPISILERLAKSFDLITTEYSVLCGDDEFFLPDAVQACVQELEADKTLVSCMGRCLLFKPISKRLIGLPAYTEMENYQVLQDDPNSRMIHHMNPYTSSTIYSVVRTPVWKLAMGVATKKLFFYALPEFQFEMSVCYQGKSKVIQNLMWLRSAENVPTRDDNLSFLEWWVDKNKANEREECLALMSSALAQGDIERLESVKKGLQAAFNVFYEWLGGDRRYFYNEVSKRVPPAIKAQINKILAVIGVHRHAPAEFGDKSLLQAAKDLESKGVQVNYEQLLRVVELVRQFYKWKVEQ
jgi:glycosyltransferase domain-containing protein